LRPGKRSSKSRLKAVLPTPGPETLIAIIDTGIDRNHRDLRHALSSDEGWNFIDDDSNLADDNGHGTQVAGVIQSAISNSQSQIRILPLKALDRSGDGTIADVVEAIDYAIAKHAAVINCSFGAPAYSHAMLDAIKRAETAGLVVVAAAGNSGNDLSQSSFYPASYRTSNLISVAASDRHNTLASFSNFSADIAAPGVEIRTAHRKNSHVHLTGTSAAAGFVSSAAGLLKSARGWVSARTIRETILKSARESFDLTGKVASKGVVNAEGALSLLLRDTKEGANRGATSGRTLSPAARAALQSGNGNLDTMRASQPQAPNAYQQTGTLPPAGYNDPKPALNDSYLTELSKAANATGIAGSLPMQAADPTAGTASVGGVSINLDNKSYNFSAPLLSLPGRAGHGLALGVSYNSRTWTKAPTSSDPKKSGTMFFNGDQGFPAPGWLIGFGMVLVDSQADPAYANGVTGKASIIYIAPDGTRRDLAYNAATASFESYDSSYLRFEAATRILRMPNGAQIAFLQESMAAGHTQFLPTWIKDRNGNLINIYYRTLSNGAVVTDYAIDTAGRRIDFNYQNDRLVSVSQNRNGTVFKFINLDYQPVTIQTSFLSTLALDPVAINGTQVYLPSRITYPNGINYRFTYTSYGQVTQIQKWVPTITGQGNERIVASTTFNLPGYDPNQPLIDCPTFSTRTEWAENWQGGTTALYTYGSGVTDPTGRLFAYSKSGLTMTSYIWAPGAGNWTKKDEVTYEQDTGLSYASNLRPIETKTTSFSGATAQIRLTRQSYIQRDGMWLPGTRDEYGAFGIGIYRRTVTEYTSYPSQYILGLPQTVSVYAGAGTTLLSRSTNNYDETGTFLDSNNQTASYFIDATGDGVIQRDGGYGASFTQRANLTSVTQHSVVNGAINGWGDGGLLKCHRDQQRVGAGLRGRQHGFSLHASDAG
jgi:hypothetical protein